jgi:hypothetical protein
MVINPRASTDSDIIVDLCGWMYILYFLGSVQEMISELWGLGGLMGPDRYFHVILRMNGLYAALYRKWSIFGSRSFFTQLGRWNVLANSLYVDIGYTCRYI